MSSPIISDADIMREGFKPLRKMPSNPTNISGGHPDRKRTSFVETPTKEVIIIFPFVVLISPHPPLLKMSVVWIIINFYLVLTIAFSFFCLNLF
jgi:hypothetical protein